MKGFAAFVMTGLPQALLVALGFAVASLVLPPLGVVSGAVVALTALRQGADKALLLLTILVLGLMVFGGLLGQPLTFGLSYGAIQWLPGLMLALLLRYSRSWQLVFQTTLVVTIAGVVLTHLLIPDLPGFWQAVLEKHLQPLVIEMGLNDAQLAEDLALTAQLMTGMMAISMILSSLLALMLGRSLQASLYNPGGFGEEFAALRIGVWPAVLALILMLGMVVMRQPVMITALLVVMALFFFQGLAVMHGIARALQWPAGSLIILYVMLILFFMPFALLLSVTGVIDGFADMRQRLANPLK